MEPPATADLRPQAVHVHGTNSLSTEDISAIFLDFGPSHVEWINDASCMKGNISSWYGHALVDVNSLRVYFPLFLCIHTGNVVWEDEENPRRALWALAEPLNEQMYGLQGRSCTLVRVFYLKILPSLPPPPPQGNRRRAYSQGSHGTYLPSPSPFNHFLAFILLLVFSLYFYFSFDHFFVNEC